MPPTFKEIRHIMNIATVHAVAPILKMVTFDADDTIYEDGGESHLVLARTMVKRCIDNHALAVLQA